LAEPIKSVLLVDFDSLHRSLTTGGGEAAARLVMKIPGWLAGLQSGRLLGPGERTFVVKRCYADPKTIGEGRTAFTTAGFRIVDCAATSAGRGVDLMMAMDAMEHLNDVETVDEFVLLSGEATLAPLLTRLKNAGRRTAIFADTHTGQAYRILAGAVLDIAAFAEFLLTHDAPESSSALAVDRSEIEAFARKIHAATNIPLFSPRTFAELFRSLTEEIIANGYHFQTTAKNVADKLSESGRSVTRRQVVFIVKGLALKGHVFSTTDSPKKLAEVFREQAMYLIENAGLKLDEAQERILSAWLVDRAPTTVGRPALTQIPPASTAQPAPPMATPSLNGARSTPVESDNPPLAAKPAVSPPAGKAKATEKPAEKPAVVPPPEHSAPLPPPREAMREPAPERAAPPPAPPRPEPRVPGSMISPDDARAAIAAKIAQSVRPKPVARPGAAPAGAAKPATPAAAPAASAPPSPPPAPERPAEDPASIESSILAAIAEAVDVLVEDGEQEEPPAAPPPPKKRGASPPAAPPRPASRPAAETRTPQRDRAEPQPPPAAQRPRQEPRPQAGEDIGDEIQRIIATYNRNRKEEPPQD
jgi:hypothetical protein